MVRVVWGAVEVAFPDDSITAASSTRRAFASGGGDIFVCDVRLTSDALLVDSLAVSLAVFMLQSDDDVLSSVVFERPAPALVEGIFFLEPYPASRRTTVDTVV